MSQQENAISKSRYWVGVLYQENMLEDWREQIDQIVQVPYAYCEHNQDLQTDGDARKEHLHLILVFPNTTTYKHALTIFGLLSKAGASCINTCKAIINIRWMYDYLIHDTEDCRKKKKHLYDKSERILGNLFDIGAYEQVSAAEKNDICKELANVIRVNGITNFMDLYVYVADECEDSIYFEILKSNASFLSALCKGMFHKVYVTSFQDTTT